MAGESCVKRLMKYKQYLQSAKWKAIRARVLARDKHACRSCGRQAIQVHHARYDADTMAGRNLEHLYSLCGGCHLATTFTVCGQKRTQNEVFGDYILDTEAPERENYPA